MPEGDSLRRAAERVGRLAGEIVRVETPHPRAAALGLVELLDGRRLERVEAVGKNLLLTFEGGLVLRSHLRMRGRWRVGPPGGRRVGVPWLVLRGREVEAILWNGPVLSIGRGAVDRLGPDIMDDPPDLEAMLARFRSTEQAREIGVALLDQRLVAGIGNVWKSESLWLARLSPWSRVADLGDGDLRRVLHEASVAMHSGRTRRAVYLRTGRPCRRCGEAIRARRQGDDARTTYWCPGCQAGTRDGSA
jgi:endonuclease VIII